MNYKLIWKAIDKEITQEESEVVKEMMLDPKFGQAYQNAKDTDLMLTNHFNHKMDEGFLSRLKVFVQEELDLPDISFNFLPIIIFVLSALSIILMFSFIPMLTEYQLKINMNPLFPYISAVGAICIGGLGLYGIDQIMLKRLKTRKLY